MSRSDIHNFYIWPNAQKAVKNINEHATYVHIPWGGVVRAYPEAHAYKEFTENVTDNYIVMPIHFLYLDQFDIQRDELFDKTNVYHIMVNDNKFEKYCSTVTIFCKKGKTTNITLSFESNDMFNIIIPLPTTKALCVDNYRSIASDTKFFNEMTNPETMEKYKEFLMQQINREWENMCLRARFRDVLTNNEIIVFVKPNNKISKRSREEE